MLEGQEPEANGIRRTNEEVLEPVFPGRRSGKDKGFRIPIIGPGFKFQDPHFLAVCASHLTPLTLSFLVCEMGHKYHILLKSS